MRMIVLLILSSLLALSCGSEPVPGPGRNMAAQAAAPAPVRPFPAEEKPAAPPGEEALEEVISEPVEIKENLFLSQISDIYLNPDEYMGRTIKLEGMWFMVEDQGQTHAIIIRYGPGCCATDALAGFEVIWGEKTPQDNAWVEACGLLEKYQLLGEEYLRLRLSSLQIMEKRGAETVWR